MGFKEAYYYKKLPEKKVKCTLFPDEEIIDNGELAKCKVRMNMNGKLKSLNYGKLHAIKTKKIEGVGFFHFMPDENALSLGAPGETLFSEHYFNETSNKEIEEIPTINQKPFQTIKHAQKAKNKIIAYAEGEPMSFYEYVKDTIDKGKEFKHVVVTNGFVNREPVRELAGKADAIMFEVRGMNEEFYEKICNGKLEPILEAIKTASQENCWVEIKMLLIKEFHESFYDVRKLVAWMLNNLNENIPLHFIAKTASETEIAKRARKIALDAGLNYVYTDNIDDKEGKNTFCPNCKKSVIIRRDNEVENKLIDGKCSCGKEISGVW